MGDYTQVKLKVKLRKETPSRILDLIHYMIRPNLFGIQVKPPTLMETAEHKLFQCERWTVMLTMRGSFEEWESPIIVKTEAEGGPWFSCLSDVKNYDREWEHFLIFLSPWVDEAPGKVVGHYDNNSLSGAVFIVYDGARLRIST